MAIAEAWPRSSVGPISRRRQLRLLVAYLTAAAAGAVLVATSPGRAKTFGAGLWFPGSGFLALGGWWTALCGLSAVLFVAAVITWFKAGATLLPPLVWLLSAGAAAWAATGPPPGYGVAIAGAIPPAAALLAAVVRRRLSRARLRRRDERAAYLPAQLAIVRTVRAAATVSAPHERELSAEDLSWLRYVLDRGLAEAGDFRLFDTQAQAASLRTQLISTGWTLGVYQRHWTPNFHGYVDAAQKRVIEQCLQKRIWSSWRLENAWGNVDLNPDPVRRDNIKMIGHLMVNLVLYELNTGDDAFSVPGGVTFRLSDRRSFRHSTHSFAESLADNFRDHRMCLYPCAPNWVYTYCNFVGLAGLTGYDTLFGTGHAASIHDRFRRNLTTEFLASDGGIVAIRSQLTGLAIPFSMPDEAIVSGLNPIFPDLAERYWAFVRREGLTVDSSGVTLTPRDGMIDFGNNRPGQGTYLCSLAHAAQEMGDHEVFEAVLAAMAEHCRPAIRDGVRFYEGASNLVNVVMPEVRLLRKDFWRRSLVERPDPAALTGPCLVEAAYPDVLVARAVSDGRHLDLVLYPDAGGRRVTAGLARLAPHADYRVDGGLEPTLAADAEGRATLRVDLHGRTHVRVTPII